MRFILWADDDGVGHLEADQLLDCFGYVSVCFHHVVLYQHGVGLQRALNGVGVCPICTQQDASVSLRSVSEFECD